MLPTAPTFVDHALSARIEAAQAAQLRELIEVVSRRLPERRAAALAIAGGCAAFVAPHISVSRAAGLGLQGPVEQADIDALEDFYRSRDTEARILVSPFAHPSLLERLGESGFRLVDLDTVLVRRLESDDTGPAPAADVAVRRARLEDAADWVRASLAGFSASGEAAPDDRAPIFEAAFHAPSVAYFFAQGDGAIAGTAAVRLDGATAHFFAASTGAGHRRRGVQGALIAARLALARASGCDLAFTVTAPGSASQRNFERCGFRPVYSLALLMKRFD